MISSADGQGNVPQVRRILETQNHSPQQLSATGYRGAIVEQTKQTLEERVLNALSDSDPSVALETVLQLQYHRIFATDVETRKTPRTIESSDVQARQSLVGMRKKNSEMLDGTESGQPPKRAAARQLRHDHHHRPLFRTFRGRMMRRTDPKPFRHRHERPPRLRRETEPSLHDRDQSTSSLH